MKRGESGEHVHLLQAALVLQGFDVPHHGMTGDPPRQNNNFLNETQSAVRQCEARFGLTVDTGVAGQEVVRRLDQENNTLYTTRAGHFGAALARTDVGLAVRKIVSASLGLTFLRSGVLNDPTLTLVNDALRVHFRLLTPGTPGDGIRRARTTADLDRILSTYAIIMGILNSSATSFQDGIPVNGAKTAAEANTGSRRVLFGPAFRNFTLSPVDLTGGLIGPNSRAAILIHEGMHAADDSNTSGNDAIHISEFDPRYNNQPADRSLFNPSSYAGFAAHVANNGDPPIRFGLGPGARQL
jgi:Putative peptidoglycan binding domain